jgi:hypothetical protein
MTLIAPWHLTEVRPTEYEMPPTQHRVKNTKKVTNAMKQIFSRFKRRPSSPITFNAALHQRAWLGSSDYASHFDASWHPFSKKDATYLLLSHSVEQQSS